MKLSVRKLGRIAKAEIDLRPLTIFVGENGTNKSWVAYGAYAGLASLGFQNQQSTRAPTTTTSAQEAVLTEVEDAFKPLFDERSTQQIAISVARQKVRLSEGSWTVWRNALGIKALLGVDLGGPEGLHLIELDVSSDDLDASRFSECEFRAVRSGAKIRIEVEMVGPDGTVSRSDTVAADIEAVRKVLIHSLMSLEFTQANYVVPFPAERILATLPGFDRMSDNLPGVVQDFIRMLGLARDRAAVGTRKAGAGLALRGLLGGRISVSSEGATGFDVAGGPTIPALASASMVRSLAGLSLYLDHLAEPGDVLVIDEPEMNAHPRAQLALMELFTELVNKGFRILITTHSPFLVDHLTNLMAAHRLTPAQRKAHGALPDASVIDPEDVAVYEFRAKSDKPTSPVHVVDILDRAAPAIDAVTFGRQSDRVANLYLDIARAEE